MRPRLDPDWLDSQYNDRSRVPDRARIFANWAEASALPRAGSPAHLDLAYGSGNGETLGVCPATAPSAAAVPVPVYIHGGYWHSLDKADHAFLAPAFNAAGALVVPNYALGPAMRFEHIVLQMAAAVAWAWRHAAGFGGAPRRVALAGHSAGGHLATMLLSCRWKELAGDLPLQPLAGALSISGLYDLEPLRHTPMLRGDLRLTPAAVARLSPAFFVRPEGAKLYTTCG